MTLSSRDRKLVMVLAPLAAFALYWMVLLNPALDKRAGLEAPLEQARSDRDEAAAAAAEVTRAKQRYEVDYAQLVKLSKAIPQSVSVSELMRELNAASKGTGIEFSKITMATPAPGTAAGTGNQPAAADSGDTTAPAVEGLDEIPIELTFDGRFFELADLFNSIQRFVSVADGRLKVHGRLIRVSEFSFDSSSFPSLTANVKATVYAAPPDEGMTDGATPVGPRGAERGDGGLKPVENFSPATAVTP